MTYLNKYWTILVLIGIALLFVSIGWGIIRGATGLDSDFNEQINPFDGSSLIPKNLEDHLTRGQTSSNIIDDELTITE